jgi:hypothetical protein
MNRKIALLAGAVLGLSACDGFREAMTAHVDVVARAGSQELSVDRFANLLGNSAVPLNKDVARTVADLWINYQLLGIASARGDSLNSPAVVDSAMWMAMMNVRSQKFLQQVSADWIPSDTSVVTEERYNQGDLFAARHILFRVPQGASQAQIDSVRSAAESVRARITPANFAELAQRYGSDGSAQMGGYLGIFGRGDMVPEFERAVIALAPGEISPLVQTQFGYHIIMRSPFSEVRDDYAQLAMQQAAFKAESTYFARLEDGADINVRSNIARKVKAVAADADGHLNDRTVLATSTAGEFTAGKLARYVTAAPPQQQLRERILAAEDSAAPDIIRFFLRNELVARQADSANVVLDSTEIGEMRRAYTAAITGAWNGLGVAPAQLADSAEATQDRERLAAQRVNRYVEALLAQQAQFVEVPPPLLFALRDKFDSRVVDAGLDRALEAAHRVRAQADSLRAAQQPPTAVPMPGAPGDSAAQGG